MIGSPQSTAADSCENTGERRAAAAVATTLRKCCCPRSSEAHASDAAKARGGHATVHPHVLHARVDPLLRIVVRRRIG